MSSRSPLLSAGGRSRRRGRPVVLAANATPGVPHWRAWTTLLERLQAARSGLAATRPAVEAGAPWPLAAVYDDSDEARWGPGEVLAHLAEMAQYWQGEIERVAGRRARAGAVRPDRDRPGPDRARRARPVAARRASCTTGSTTRSTRFDRRWRSLTAGGPGAARAPPARGEMTVGADARAVHRRPPRRARRPARADPRGRRQPPADAGTRMFILYAIPIGIAGRAVSSAAGSIGSAELRLRWVPLDPARAGRPGRRSSPTPAGGWSATPARPSTSPRPPPSSSRSCATSGSRASRSSRSVPAATSPRSSPTAGRCRPIRRRSPRSAASPPGYTNSDRRRSTPALLPLTDLFALPAWLPFANVFSVGDVLIGVGVAATIALAMRVRRPGRRRSRRHPPVDCVVLRRTCRPCSDLADLPPRMSDDRHDGDQGQDQCVFGQTWPSSSRSTARAREVATPFR